MTQIIAGVFDDNAAADRTIANLHDAGFGDNDIDRFAVNPPGRHNRLPLGGDEQADEGARGGEFGALAGAAVGGAVGAVAGLVATPLIGPVAIANVSAPCDDMALSCKSAKPGRLDRPAPRCPINRPITAPPPIARPTVSPTNNIPHARVLSMRTMACPLRTNKVPVPCYSNLAEGGRQNQHGGPHRGAFSRSRISVSSFSLGVGSGGLGAAAFLRISVFIVLTSRNTQKATIRNSNVA